MAQLQELGDTYRQQPLLSYIVVAHNHGQCICRCLDSILSQEMKYSYEIIVGDDRSSDNTWTILEDYKSRYPDLFTIYRVNSDDCNPLSLSDRASYNRGCAYKLVRGKYYAEVDGDDFLLPGDTYQKQIELLEEHPECWLCMQNMAVVGADKPFDTAKRWFSNSQLKNLEIISGEYYISHPTLFSQHQSFVYRRNCNKSPIELLGLDYEDTTVTLFHLQFGNIIYLNQSGYQYISYPGGINRLLSEDDRMVRLALLQLEHMLYFPKFSRLIFKASLPELNHLLKVTNERKLQLTTETYRSLSRYKGFAFRYYGKEKHNMLELCRIKLARFLLSLMNRYQLTANIWIDLSERVLL